MLSFKEQRELQEGVAQWFKDLLPKKVKHEINRMNHKEKYKEAIKQYHLLKREIDKEGKEKWLKKRGFARSKGQIVGNIDNYLKDLAADLAGLKPREFKKILDKETRYN